MKPEVKRGPWGKVIAGLLSLVVAVATLSAWPSTGAEAEAERPVPKTPAPVQTLEYVEDVVEPPEEPVHIPLAEEAAPTEAQIPAEDEEPDVEDLYSEEEIEAIAKTVYGEALVTGSDTEMAAVAWCILNRVDSPSFPNSIIGVVTAKCQFHGYRGDNPVPEHIKELVKDVLTRWTAEKNSDGDVGRVLPADYLYFWGDGRHNHFTTEYLGGVEWDWSLPTPYES